MAQGSIYLFEEFSKTIGDGSHTLGSDAFKVMLLSSQHAVDILVSDPTPDSADVGYTEVTGGTSYVAGGAVITCTWTEVGGIATFKVTSGDTVWVADASGPTDIRTALIYNTTHAGTNDAIGYIDMTTDGSTPVSLQAGDVSILWTNQQNIFTQG